MSTITLCSQCQHGEIDPNCEMCRGGESFVPINDNKALGTFDKVEFGMIVKRLDQASMWPWHYVHGDDRVLEIRVSDEKIIGRVQRERDAVFISNAPRDIDTLCRWCSQLLYQNESLRRRLNNTDHLLIIGRDSQPGSWHE